MPAYFKVLKKILVNLSVLTASLIISLILLELAVRFFLPVYDPRGMLDYKYYPEDDAVLCLKNSTVRLWKNTGDYNVRVRINRYGFRDGKDLLSSTYNDIFVLGDSMGLGWGVEEEKRFSDLLQAIIGVPVYNISAPAGDLDGYKKLLDYAQKKGARIRNLILTVFMENDLQDYDTQTNKLNRAGRPDRGKQRHYQPNFFRLGLRKVGSLIRRNSAAYQALSALAHRNDFLYRIAIKSGWIRSNYDGMRRNVYSEKVINSSLARLLALAKPFNALVVIVPSRGLWIGDNRGIERKVHDKFISLLGESGAKCVDLRQVFEKTASPLQHYFKNDGHLNEKGHLAVAMAINAVITVSRWPLNLE